MSISRGAQPDRLRFAGSRRPPPSGKPGFVASDIDVAAIYDSFTITWLWNWSPSASSTTARPDRRRSPERLALAVAALQYPWRPAVAWQPRRAGWDVSRDRMRAATEGDGWSPPSQVRRAGLRARGRRHPFCALLDGARPWLIGKRLDPRDRRDAAVSGTDVREENCSTSSAGTASAPQFYPRWHCVRCHGDQLEWRTSGGKGKIHSFTVVYRAPTAALQGDGALHHRPRRSRRGISHDDEHRCASRRARNRQSRARRISPAPDRRDPACGAPRSIGDPLTTRCVARTRRGEPARPRYRCGCRARW